LLEELNDQRQAANEHEDEWVETQKEWESMANDMQKEIVRWGFDWVVELGWGGVKAGPQTATSSRMLLSCAPAPPTPTDAQAPSPHPPSNNQQPAA